MRVRASFHGRIRRPWQEESRELEVADGSTIDALLESLGYPAEERRLLTAVIDGKRRKLSSELQPGDHVRIVRMAAGG